MIEKFEFTTNYFDAQIKEANNQFASLTWARLTWEQRVTLHPNIAVSVVFNKDSKAVRYHSPLCMPIVCETLCQMQF